MKTNMLCWLSVSSYCCVVFLAVGIAELSALQEFEDDVREFKLKVDDTDRRLGAVFCQAFDDASGLEHAFKVQKLTISLCHTFTHAHLFKSPFTPLMSAGFGYVW